MTRSSVTSLRGDPEDGVSHPLNDKPLPRVYSRGQPSPCWPLRPVFFGSEHSCGCGLNVVLGWVGCPPALTITALWGSHHLR